jgi:hypothetical protein
MKHNYPRGARHPEGLSKSNYCGQEYFRTKQLLTAEMLALADQLVLGQMHFSIGV